MLVPTRKIGEKIRIGDNVLITVLPAERGRVRLGFDAPRNVEIMRVELESKTCEVCGLPDRIHDRCNKCGYTYCDAMALGDHRLCGEHLPKKAST